MWPWFLSRVAWKNPCGAIALTPEVCEQYQSAVDELRQQWYEQWPDVDSDPRWYARTNPESALAYPPGFLKKDLDVAVLFTASAPDTDGYFWANERYITGIDSYQALDEALVRLETPVEMLILSGEQLNLDRACGVCWREHNDVGFSVNMPQRTALLLHEMIKPTGIFILGSCRGGDHPELVQEMANRIRRPVAGAQGVCRGVRTELLEEDGIFWTLGGYAEGKAFTLAEPEVA